MTVKELVEKINKPEYQEYQVFWEGKEYEPIFIESIV